MKPRKPIKKRSAKGRQLDRMDALQSQILRRKRGKKCEICGRPARCVFHILEKGTYPRIRYFEWNLLWTCWDYCHDPWHHYGPRHPKTRWIENEVIRLRGDNYDSDLKIQDAIHPRMKPFQVDIIEAGLKQELHGLQKV